MDDTTSLQTTPPTEKKGFIFGSPPEPLFNQGKHNGGSVALLQQSLQSLANLNSKVINADKCQGVFRSEGAVSYFMYICNYFNLPPEVKYRAIELFHRFMSQHICELYEHVQASQQTSSPINWETVEGRLTHQITLRALSCVQLASKIGLHYKIVSVGRTRSFLANCGFRYTATSLVQSEIRILKTLNFHVHGPTPLDYVEILIETLGHNDSSLPISQLYGVSIKMLDLYYLCSQKIMKKLHTREGSRDTKHRILENDCLWLASGIIGASAFILNHSKSDYVVKCVSQVTCIIPDDIMNFAAVLVEYIVTDN